MPTVSGVKGQNLLNHCFLELYKIVENFEIEVMYSNLERGH